jgi:hypothetical protein
MTSDGDGTGLSVSVPRQRDRRRGFTDLVTAMSRAIAEGADAALMRGAFEEQLRRMIGVRAVRLRDGSSRWTQRVAESSESVESIAVEVPGPDPGATGVLEASFDPGCRLGEWDFQMLGAAAHVGAMVLEIDRAHVQIARLAGGAGGGVVKPRRDGAAPLVGSSAVMADLRNRIERIAKTEFTVLLEGESSWELVY